jgi:FkbM family methyltransferase
MEAMNRIEPASGEERRERAEFLEAAAAFTPLVAVQTRSGVFVVPTSGESIGRTLFVKRARGEMRTLKLAMKALKRLGVDAQGTFVDVGANIGTTSITALTRHRFARAVAVEPAPENLRLLRANAALNGLEDRLVVMGLALSDGEGEADLVLNEANSGDHRIGRLELEAHPVAADAPTERVRLTTLDRLQIEHAGLLWIDAQGHEGHILAGASALLATGVPAVVELWPQALAAAGGLDRYLAAAAEHYTDVLDLDRADGEIRPITALPDVVEAYGEGFTDVLLVRR